MTVQVAEDAVIGKVTRRLVWFLFAMYAIGFLDRTNIGFAALSMNHDLALNATAFGLASTFLYVAYLIFDVPSNMMMARVGPRRWLSRIMVTFGLASACTAFAVGPTSLYVIRFLVGVGEAGLLAGIVLYVTYWFPRSHRARVTGLIMLAMPFSGLIGSTLSGFLLQIDRSSGLAGWQWLFIVEGLPAVLLGLVALLYLPDRPRHVAWLTVDERDRLEGMLAQDNAVIEAESSESVLSELLSPGVLILLLPIFALTASLNTNVTWAPQIVQAMHEGGSFGRTGILIAIPNLLALVCMPLWAAHSDRRSERRWHFVCAMMLACVGWLLVLGVASPDIRLLGLCCCNVGSSCALIIFYTLPAEILSKRARPAGIGVISAGGIVASLSVPFIVGKIHDLTGGFTASLGAICVLLCLGSIAIFFTRSTTMKEVPTVALGAAKG